MHGAHSTKEGVVELNPMRIFAVVFFISLPLWTVLTVVLIFSPSSGLGKADGVFAVLALGSLFMMIGLRLYASAAAQTPPPPRPGGFTG
jgi:hypothetical protein